jgi:hypothetical protein
LHQADEALAELHRAWRTIHEFPNMMAHNRVLTRIEAGMASAYTVLGEQERAEQLLREAETHLQSALANPGGVIHGVMPDELCHAMAVSYLRMNRPDAATEVLSMAVEKGCRDEQWMESDPELNVLLASGRLNPLIDRVRHFRPLQFRTAARLV